MGATLMLGRAKKRNGIESLERRDLLTVAFDLGPSEDWQTQLQEFTSSSMAEVADACGPTSCESLTLVHRYDGWGNNADEPAQGATVQPLLRVAAPAYADGMSSPAGPTRPNARTVSNMVANQTEAALSENHLSNLVWIWGQFIDHDITLTPANSDDPLNVPIPSGDPQFDPMGTGTVVMPFNRAAAFDGTGHSTEHPRAPFNAITAYLDGSAVYGSDDERASALRTFDAGRLKTSDGELLPYNVDGLENEGGTSDSMFLAGDIRANENVALTSIHTMWVREHNLIAGQVALDNADWNDEQVFQYARAIVTAEIQAITFNEFLPSLLGPDAISSYDGYDATADPTITTLFAGATYRFGHSMLSEDLMLMDSDHQEMPDGPMSLRNAFFSPHSVTPAAVDVVLQGASHQLARQIDTKMVESVRNFMFGQPGAGGFDLATLNIQRGRDLGLASYNEMRVAVGLPSATDFSDVTSDVELASDLEALYGDVDELDVWVGALAEDHLPGSAVGELIHVSLVDQFERIRDSDRMWYENRFDGMLRQDLRRTRLKDVIERNSNAANLQDNVFFATETLPEQGDVNSDLRVNMDDLRDLSDAISEGVTDEMFDINTDGLVDGADAQMLATSILGLRPGDANGDGQFNPSDLVQIFQQGEYEDGVEQNSTWFDGDFNGDREFTSTDIILALQTGRYAKDGAEEPMPMMARRATDVAMAIAATDLDKDNSSSRERRAMI